MKWTSVVPIEKGMPIQLAKSPKEQATMIHLIQEQVEEAKTLQGGGKSNYQRDIKCRKFGNHFGSKTCLLSRANERGSQQMFRLPKIREELQ
ncbi:MAG: hypothetical protein EZS28_009933 [Streblomastix strix]|uniref:Uncharacterized protein n=1 Tax=Streblomastix strix TaxID=222440 RepID=A0A5J4WIK8_9EUKA|nr:MAG: hypothetical protein EZS28_009933 [Streblomastix strix]